MTEIQVQSIHFDADQKLLSFISEKVKKLHTYHDRIISGEVFLRLDKSDDHMNKVSEVRITVPGHELFARKQCKSFEEATDHVIDALKSQISKIKK